MKMTRELYDVAASLAGDARGGYLPEPFRIAGAVPHTLPLEAKAVYLVVDGAGEVTYVGSVCRIRSTAVRERVSEHVREWIKDRHWTHVYLVPLAPDTPARTVKRIEGRVGRRLKPAMNRRLPI